MIKKLEKLIEQERDELIENRRWLHQHPELSFEEYSTSLFIEKFLRDVGGLHITRPTETSVVANLDTGIKGKTIAFRADIDALPIYEDNTLEFRSLNKGIMHACGHDAHTAMLLSAAKVMSSLRDDISGEIRFIFQHAEELPPGGAIELINKGVLDGVDEVYGLHVTTILPTGVFGVCPGVLTSSTDRFDIHLKGKGGHSSMPHECADPIVCGAELISALQTIVSRNVPPSDEAILSVCSAHAGKAYNVIPDDMSIIGSVRTYNEKVRKLIETRSRIMTQNISEAHGLTGEFKYSRGYDSIVNDAKLTNDVKRIIEKYFSAEHLQIIDPIAPGDDFCYYSQKCPGFFVELGSANSIKNTDSPHHNSKYKLDEDALYYGFKYIVALLYERTKI